MLTESVENSHQRTNRANAGVRGKTVAVVGLLYAAVVATAIAATSCAPFSDAGTVASPGSTTDTTSVSNAAPVIFRLEPAEERLLPLTRCRLACEAEDADGDALTYVWTAGQGDIVGDGPTVLWCAPDEEGLFRVSVVVEDGHGGTAESSISLRIMNNAAPEFQSVPSFVGIIHPGDSVSLSCSATDPDGDPVSYKWHATYGEVLGEGESVTWRAPYDAGSYVVTVVAEDPDGAECVREVLLNVTQSPTPRLGTFVVEAVDAGLLKFEEDTWDTYLGESYRIECVVLEGDEPYSYAWTASKGSLTADGAVAVWTAPDAPGPARIAVGVTDSLGNINYGQVRIYVQECTCAFASAQAG